MAVADALMARAIKVISVERGADPAELTLVPFGGAGAMHACGVARELGMTRILVPPSPGLLCAWGALTADVVHERVANLHALLPVEIAALQAELVRAVDAALAADGVAPGQRYSFCSAHLRYQGQSFELAVEAGRWSWRSAFMRRTARATASRCPSGPSSW